MTAYLYRMPSGIPGDVSRPSQSTIETGFFNPSNPFSAYGLPGKIVSGQFVPLAANDPASVVYGFLVRPFPTTGANASDPLGTSVPPTSGECNILRRGYLTVLNVAGTPALNGAVYSRIAAASSPTFIGDIEAAAVSGDTIQLNATFMNAGDASGNVEIGYNI
jgi:hypothetical protein